jgi:hypothetical protein
MPRRYLSRARLLLLAVGLLFVSRARAGDPVPCKVDFGVAVRCNIQCGPQAAIPRAPWYTYFPVEPNVIAKAPGTTSYPPWPATFPPTAPAPTAPAPTAPGQAPVPMTYHRPGAGYASPVQAVSYAPSQVPSYWYGR